MLRVKFGDKKYLCAYDLNVELFDLFGLEVEDVVPLRSIYIIETSKGKKILKKIDYSIDRLNYIYDVLEIIKEQFPKVLTIEKSLEDKCYVVWKDGVYVLLDLIEGRECSVSNEVDLRIASQGLAKLHNSSLRVKDRLDADRYKEFLNTVNLKDYYIKALNILSNLEARVRAYKYPNSFDSLFLGNVDYYKNTITDCIELLDQTLYSELINNSSNLVLCHNDLAHHNILIRDDEAYFIDFDYCAMGLRVMDIAQLIYKSIKNCGFELDKCLSIIDSYEAVSPLSVEEKKLIYVLIKFPYDYSTIISDYYYRNKDWDEETFVCRLENKINYKEEMEIFLREYKEKFWIG